MKRITIYEERCKGCGLCYDVCPKKILKPGDHLNSKGFHPITCIDESLCISCGTCYRVCPDMVFEIRKPDAPAGK